MIAAKRRDLVATIECKKTDKGILFLRPVGLSNTGDRVFEFRCPVAPTRRVPEDTIPSAACMTVHLDAPSVQAEFCIMAKRGSSKEASELLESEAAILVRGTTEYVQRQRCAARNQAFEGGIYIPIIVTTAPVYSVRYVPTEVSLETGEFDRIPEEIREEPWVRVRKAFSSDSSKRSVFVVSARNLISLLGSIRITSTESEIDAEPLALPRDQELLETIRHVRD